MSLKIRSVIHYHISCVIFIPFLLRLFLLCVDFYCHGIFFHLLFEFVKRRCFPDFNWPLLVHRKAVHPLSAEWLKHTLHLGCVRILSDPELFCLSLNCAAVLL